MYPNASLVRMTATSLLAVPLTALRSSSSTSFATPAALDDYFDKKAIEGGNITRTVLCKLEDEIGEDGAIFAPYSSEQRARIDAMLERLMNETYDNDGGLQPTYDRLYERLKKAWQRGNPVRLTIYG